MVIKGILDPEDAKDAVRFGADGIVVSNHGGRQLDGVLSSARALPAIADAVKGELKILADSGIRTGLDVVRMLAENEVSSMPVIDERNQVVGFISDGDVMGAIAQHRAHTIFTGGDASMLYFDDQSLEQRIEDLKDRCVMDFATRQVVCARPEQSIARVAALLAKKKFKKLPVVDDEGKLVGVIRRSAITKYIFGILFQ